MSKKTNDKTLADFIADIEGGDALEAMTPALSPETQQEIKNAGDRRAQIIAVLKTIQDPEIPVNLWDLGLIYAILEEGDKVRIDMTLTTPNCPVAEAIPTAVKKQILRYVKEVTILEINLVWEPRWSQDKMTEAAMLELGLL